MSSGIPGHGPRLAPGQVPTHHQILQGQQLVHVPQDLNFTLVGQFGGWEAARLLLLLLNDLQALVGQSSPNSGSGISGHQEPKCSLSSLPRQPFPFPHTFASAIPLTSKALPQPYLSLFHPFTLQYKPCLLQKAFMNFTFTRKSILLLIAPYSLSWNECGVVKKAQALRHLLGH